MLPLSDATNVTRSCQGMCCDTASVVFCVVLTYCAKWTVRLPQYPAAILLYFLVNYVLQLASCTIRMYVSSQESSQAIGGISDVR
jgi:hypothetical protein